LELQAFYGAFPVRLSPRLAAGKTGVFFQDNRDTICPERFHARPAGGPAKKNSVSPQKKFPDSPPQNPCICAGKTAGAAVSASGAEIFTFAPPVWQSLCK
jgi:hypothetical protein